MVSCRDSPVKDHQEALTSPMPEPTVQTLMGRIPWSCSLQAGTLLPF
jgi:hypothetical protein